MLQRPQVSRCVHKMRSPMVSHMRLRPGTVCLMCWNYIELSLSLSSAPKVMMPTVCRCAHACVSTTTPGALTHMCKIKTNKKKAHSGPAQRHICYVIGNPRKHFTAQSPSSLIIHRSRWSKRRGQEAHNGLKLVIFGIKSARLLTWKTYREDKLLTWEAEQSLGSFRLW